MAAAGAEVVSLQWRPFAMALPRPLGTARGTLAERRGWLLRLSSSTGAVGWGEAAPLEFGEAGRARLDQTRAELEGLALMGEPIHGAMGACRAAPSSARLPIAQLEAVIAAQRCSADLAFALGSALAELTHQVGAGAGGWLPAPASAQLLPAGAAALDALEAALQSRQQHPQARPKAPEANGPCFKWKVAVHPDAEERALLEHLLARLPAAARLRLDANGQWDRSTAAAWADRLAGDERLQWLEQPLAPTDHAGLEELARRLPVALDESLREQPQLRQGWRGWQVRRPSQEGDPRPLLAELAAGRPQLVLSTAFEAGIGRRWLHHLAGLQAQGPTPAAPGLALDWQPSGPLVSADPQQVWEAAAWARVS